MNVHRVAYIINCVAYYGEANNSMHKVCVQRAHTYKRAGLTDGTGHHAYGAIVSSGLHLYAAFTQAHIHIHAYTRSHMCRALADKIAISASPIRLV
jgi:hypothetical protein